MVASDAEKEQLADWIEAGLNHPNVTEGRRAMFGKYIDRDGYEARILALALIGKVGDPETAFNSVQPEMVEKGYQLDNAEMAAHLGIPVVLAEVVDALHRLGNLPAKGIVNVLRLGSVGIH